MAGLKIAGCVLLVSAFFAGGAYLKYNACQRYVPQHAMTCFLLQKNVPLFGW